MQIKFKEYPHMKPIRMPTKDKGFFGGIWLWIMETRRWEITQDWNFTLDSTKYVIPKGFIFDGASVPKYFRSYLSPMGVLLIGGLVHDYGYKYETLRLSGKKPKALKKKTQKWMDQTFRDINIDQNGFKIINWIAYLALRGGGWLAWRKHRKVNAQWDDGLK